MKINIFYLFMFFLSSLYASQYPDDTFDKLCASITIHDAYSLDDWDLLKEAKVQDKHNIFLPYELKTNYSVYDHETIKSFIMSHNDITVCMQAHLARSIYDPAVNAHDDLKMHLFTKFRYLVNGKYFDMKNNPRGVDINRQNDYLQDLHDLLEHPGLQLNIDLKLKREILLGKTRCELRKVYDERFPEKDITHAT